MCGIAGYIINKPLNDPEKWIPPLIEPLRGRGPDDEGVTLINLHHNEMRSFKSERTISTLAARLPFYRHAKDFPHDIALLQTRYAIIDLSYHGHQPYISSDHSIAAVFNGEIYNYIELRSKLKDEGVDFHTSSDTEVLVEGYRIWGNDLWEKINGFWAVVLYDRRDKSIIFSRDRVGVAPLYYRNTPDGLFFASTLQALINIRPEDKELDRDAIIGFMQTGIKDHDFSTFFKDIHSFPSGSYTKLPADSCSFHDKDIHRFWEFPKKRLTETDVSFKDAVKTFRDYFFQAVELRLRSDVKVGFELSGGIDSSCVVAAAATMRAGRITTYTAKIKDADEEPFARMMKQKHDIDYRVVESIDTDFTRDCAAFHRIMEEPFDNPNVYTHHLMLRQMKREGVHVVITGAGGDEVFGGYESSFWPAAYRDMKKQGGKQFWHADLYEICRRYMTPLKASETLRHYFVAATDLLRPVKPSKRSSGIALLPTSALRHFQRYSALNFQERTLYHFQTALLPYYMRSSDHFTMSVPIEHRFPLLDYNIIEIGLQAPLSYLYKHGWTKYLMRKAMEPYLPPEITWRRKKMGFTFPYRSFLRTNREILEPLLSALRVLDIAENAFGSYTDVLNRSPQQLWRLLSVAMWIKNL